MLALLAAVTLAATPARALGDAEAVLYVPRMDRAAPLFSWLATAGARAPLLRPAAWKSELSPLLGIDVSDLAAYRAAGLDPTAAATFNVREDDRLSCFGLRDSAAFEARVKQALAGRGEPWKLKEKGATLFGAKLGSRVVAGYLLRGKEACTAYSPSDVAPLLKEGAAAFARAPTGKGWAQVAKLPGVAFMVTSRGVAGVRAEGARAIAEGFAQESMGLALAPGEKTPYAGVPPAGLFFGRLRLTRLPQTAEALRKKNLRPCRFCDAALNEALTPLAAAVAESATGNALFKVEQLVLKGSLRTEAAQYFALRNALLLELRDEAPVQEALAALTGYAGAKQTEDGVALTTRDGALLLGRAGKHFYAASDAEVARALLAAAKAAPGGSATHAVEWAADPARVTAAFSQVSLLDVLGSRELAALFAVGTELGPLFGASERLSGTADPDGEGLRWTATWALKP